MALKSTRLRPVIRVFVSSTFSDMKHERNVLQADVFPQLEKLCLENGFQFQAIDLRWGISSEAGLDHRTMRICFDELRRAQEISPEPNFLVLLGDRYGWRPLPEEISQGEFDRLISFAKGENQNRTVIPGTHGKSSCQIIEEWYRCDKNILLSDTQSNAVDYETLNYILQPRTQKLGDGRDFKRRADDPTKDTQDWMDIQQVLWRIINVAFPMELLTRRFHRELDQHITEVNVENHPKRAVPQIARFQASATEQEIWCGALSASNAENHVIACYREITNKDEFNITELGDFYNLKESGEFDSFSSTCQSDLKVAICHWLGKNVPISIPFNRLKRENDKLAIEAAETTTKKFCDDVFNRIKPIIERQIEEYWEKSKPSTSERAARELNIERNEHKRFGTEHGSEKSFVGRGPELQTIRDYLKNNSIWPLMIHGASGCGKTALLARAFEEIPVNQKPIIRFIGTTPNSSDIRSLLLSLCQELRERYPRADMLPSDTKALQNEFDQQLRAVTQEQPLILFLDALDQLSDADNGRLLNWLTYGQLSTHVKLVVSCLSDRPDDEPAGLPSAELKLSQLIEKNSIDLDALSEAEAEILLFRNWLPQAGRMVNDLQRESIGKILEFRECCQPIYLKLLFEEVRLWHSYDVVPELGENVSALFSQLIKRLRQEMNHGRLLVDRVLGYLAAARHGLAENEILEILFVDPDYKEELKEDYNRNRHELPFNATRIPIAIWSRLRFELAPYLTERAAVGANVLTFYHRQLADWVQEHFMKLSDPSWQPHQRLACYFRDLADPENNLSWKGDSTRAFLELPFHLARTDTDELTKILFDYNWLQAKTDKGLVNELIRDYDEALPTNKDAQLMKSVLRLSAAVLSKDKGQLRTQLYGRLMEPISQVIQDFLNSLPLGGCWLRLLSPSLEQAGGLLRFSLSGHTGRVFTVVLNGKGTIAVSGSEDYSLRVWDTNTGEELYKLDGHAARINGVALTKDGSLAISVSDDQTVKIWDLSKGEELRTLRGHKGVIRAVSVTSDSNRIISISLSAISKNRELKIWELLSGNELHTLTSERGQMDVILIADNGKTAIYPLKNTIVDLHTGKQLTAVKHFEPDLISNVISGDGRRVIISSDRALKAWDEVKIDEWSTLEFLRQAFKIIGEGLPTDEVMAASVLIGGTRGLCGLGDTMLTVWDLSSQRRLYLKGHTAPINAVAVTSDGNQALSASFDGTLKLWNLNTGDELITLEGHTGPVHDVAINSNGTMAVSASFDKTVRVWDLSSFTKKPPPKRHMGRINDLVITADNKCIISASADHTLKIWDIASGELIRTLEGHFKSVNAISVSLNGQRAISASDDYTLRVWDLQSGKIEHTLRPHMSWLWDVAMSPDGRIAISNSSAMREFVLKVWDLVSGRELYTLVGHSKTVFSVAIFAGGSRAISASADKTLKVWDLSRGYEVYTLIGHSAPVFDVIVSQDGSRAISISTDEILKVWELSSGKLLFTLGDKSINVDLRNSIDLMDLVDIWPGRGTLLMEGCSEGGGTLALTSDCSVVVYASKQNTIITWNLLTGERHTLTGHSDQIRQVTVTSDDAQIVSVSNDRTVKVWNLKGGNLVATFVGDSAIRACTITSDGLTVIVGEDSGLIHFLRLEKALCRKKEHRKRNVS